MDAPIAIALIIAGMVPGFRDMKTNYCGEPGGCLAANATDPRLALSYGRTLFRTDDIGSEFYVRYDFGTRFGPFQPVAGLSISDQNAVWLGAGAAWTKNWDSGIYAQLHLMGGVYQEGDGPDIGHPIEFRSGAEFGYEFDNGWRLGASVDHRSNAGIGDTNPGLETIQIRMSVPLK